MKTNREINETYGKFNGYPDCCINSFYITSLKEYKRPTANQITASNQTGFIPCQDCSLLVISGNIKLKELIKNRICEIPFNENYL